MDDFEQECREHFAKWSDLVNQSAYHSLKRKYREKADEVLDLYNEWRELNNL